MDETGGVTERNANRPNRLTGHRFDTDVLQKPNNVFVKKTAEQRFDAFVADKCERYTQFFGIINLVFIVYGVYVFCFVTFFEGSQNYAFITVEQTEVLLNRLIWVIRLTCCLLVLTIVTLKAYFKKPEQAHKDVLFSRTDPRNLELTREWEKNEANKFMYVVMQLIVFLMAVISFIYAHCTQLITVGLPATDPNSLYWMKLCKDVGWDQVSLEHQIIEKSMEPFTRQGCIRGELI
ncbi:uncharacterized protein LOC134845640 isoform X2 [Symsagittifera roscoffensis]|uniref:uncharacterized protein LOC134845640 isoform X2 n=1 Tax=Symsagittifera roscoffensis TaxID=84072 RepID=UPI00307B64F6